MRDDPHAAADAFLSIAGQFRLGALPTEQCHPETMQLSVLARDDLATGFSRFKSLDLAALAVVDSALPQIEDLARDIGDTFRSGHRVFLGGCGATGRLALTAETLCREGLLDPDHHTSVVGFMAGGDAALIRSLEGFEDREHYGRRQLEELGFADGDLMLGITEGGETPFVIAATEHALTLSGRSSWFCYCNPEETLAQVAERSERILKNPRVHRLPLITGPMALAGSTRLQATTVQLTATVLALKNWATPERIATDLKDLTSTIARLDYEALAPFTKKESAIYLEGGHVLYTTDHYGLTVLTDTTERAPTFSLNPFENLQSPEQPPSLCYLSIPSGESAEAAWKHLLRRNPRTLEWPDVTSDAGANFLSGYDISRQAEAHRGTRLRSAPVRFVITPLISGNGCRLEFADLQLDIPCSGEAWIQNLVLKVLLNAHSTLLMGRLGRYEGNLMTWVRPSNHKLIDRAIRYIRSLLGQRGLPTTSYVDTCHALFQTRSTMAPDQSIVLETLKYLECGSR